MSFLYIALAILVFAYLVVRGKRFIDDLMQEITDEAGEICGLKMW